MAGMAAYVPTPKGDAFKPGGTVQWVEESIAGRMFHMGQLWSRAENPVRIERRGYWQQEVRYIGKFWFVVTGDGSPFLVSERDLTHVMARGEHLQLI